jgi:hypothetical protein
LGTEQVHAPLERPSRFFATNSDFLSVSSYPGLREEQLFRRGQAAFDTTQIE